MKKLEPIIGKPDHSGGWLVEPSSYGVHLQRIIDREKTRMGKILVRVRDDLDSLDIQYDHPKVATTSGLIPDTTKPMIASGGYHVGYANWVKALEEEGRWRLELDWEVSKTGRTLRATRWIDIEADTVMAFDFEDAFILLAKHGVLFEEVDQVDDLPQPAPESDPEPKPAFAKVEKPESKPSAVRKSKPKAKE